MKYKTISLAVDGDGVAHLTLARPEIHNAMNMELVRELRHALRAIAENAKIRAVVLTGEGKSFCAGGDLNWMTSILGQSRAQRVAESAELADMLYEFDTLPKVVIGRINGAATGGGFGLTCACDVAIGSTAARFALTEARLGLLPANIAPYVVRRMGLARSRRFGLTARFIDAVEAERLGLLDRVETPENLDGAVDEELDLILSLPEAAIASTKRLFSHVYDRQPLDCRIYTSDRLADAWETAEAKEGIAAFLDKRPAGWNIRRARGGMGHA
jgi:methylglutaconyl-CoA hydratase